LAFFHQLINFRDLRALVWTPSTVSTVSVISLSTVVAAAISASATPRAAVISSHV
jgi:hypothetical protein